AARIHRAQRTRLPGYGLRDLACELAAAAIPVLDVCRGEVAGGDHDLHVGHTEVRRGAAQHPGRRVVAILVDALIEVDLVEIAQECESMKRDPPVTTPLFQVLLEVHLSCASLPVSSSVGSSDQQYRLVYPHSSGT